MKYNKIHIITVMVTHTNMENTMADINMAMENILISKTFNIQAGTTYGAALSI